MANLYVEYGYVEEGYVEGSYLPDEVLPESVEVLPEIVKVFGFSKNFKIKPTVEDPADEILRDQSRRYGRKAFAFPAQNIG